MRVDDRRSWFRCHSLALANAARCKSDKSLNPIVSAMGVPSQAYFAALSSTESGRG